jgi:predicted ATP-dependent endonuclease of OLD family
MLLRSVRVQKFKCIEDSEEFSVDQITCLVGKNEAGKSALLEALYKLNPVDASKGDFKKTEYPRRHWSDYKEIQETQPDNVLTTMWELTPTERQAAEQIVSAKALRSGMVRGTRGYSNVTSWRFDCADEEVVKYQLSLANLTEDELSALEQSKSIADQQPRQGQERRRHQLIVIIAAIVWNIVAVTSFRSTRSSTW